LVSAPVRLRLGAGIVDVLHGLLLRIDAHRAWVGSVALAGGFVFGEVEIGAHLGLDVAAPTMGATMASIRCTK